MRKRFGIRSCRTPEPGELDYRRCLDHIIKNCSAPCIRKVSLEEYRQRVLRACEFLEGESRELLEQLETEMKVAAEKLDFERAAQIRNMLEDLRRTTKPTRRFTRGSLPSCGGSGGRSQALADGITPPGTSHTLWSVSIFRTLPRLTWLLRWSVLRMACRTNRITRRYRIRTVEGQDDFASMRKWFAGVTCRILLESKEISPDLAEYNQEPVEEAVKRVGSLGRLETGSLDKLETGSGDNPETGSVEKAKD